MFSGLNEIEDNVSGIFRSRNKFSDRVGIVFWFSAGLFDGMELLIVCGT